jgi:hypothetical protein
MKTIPEPTRKQQNQHDYKTRLSIFNGLKTGNSTLKRWKYTENGGELLGSGGGRYELCPMRGKSSKLDGKLYLCILENGIL